MESDMDRRVLVFAFAFETLDSAQGRGFFRPPDRFLLELLKSPEVERLIVVDPWRSMVADIIKRRRFKVPCLRFVEGKEFIHISPRRLLRAPADSIEQAKVDSSRLLDLVGRRAHLDSRRTGALITFDPILAAYGEASWVDRRVYVGDDDHSQRYSDSRRELYAEAQLEAVRRSDRSFVVSDELGRRVGGQATTMPNGISTTVWAKRPPLQERWGNRQPYAIYSGVVEGRVDPNLFAQVLLSIPRLVLAGPMSRSPEMMEILALPGVEYVGELTQQDLAAATFAAAVGVIPHRVTTSTRAMSPLKFFEYLAAGLPVVATDLEPLHGYGSRVALCQTATEWETAVGQALALGTQNEADRRDTVDAFSWARRFEPAILAAVDLGKRG